MSGRCCNVRLCYLAAFLHWEETSVWEEHVATFTVIRLSLSVFYANKNASRNYINENY
jgi:hypothetical protein